MAYPAHDRLPEIIPVMPPVLTHDDLWSGNLLTGQDGHPFRAG